MSYPEEVISFENSKLFKKIFPYVKADFFYLETGTLCSVSEDTDILFFHQNGKTTGSYRSEWLLRERRYAPEFHLVHRLLRKEKNMFISIKKIGDYHFGSINERDVEESMSKTFDETYDLTIAKAFKNLFEQKNQILLYERFKK